MTIEFYDFGEIVVNGRRYTRDIIITPSKIISNWWRKEGHKICLDDLREILNEQVDFVVLGTGYYGLVKVDSEVREYFERKGVKVIVKPTREAVEEFNKLASLGKRVLGAFHLTC